VCKVQHFQGCSPTTLLAIDVGVLVEAEGELAKLLDVAWAYYDGLFVRSDGYHLCSQNQCECADGCQHDCTDIITCPIPPVSFIIVI
jgi:hypothetical protein